MQEPNQEIIETINSARDSVWAINKILSDIAAGASSTLDMKSTIERNVAHLTIVVSDPEISGSGVDISDIHAAIAAGNAALSQNIWTN